MKIVRTPAQIGRSTAGWRRRGLSVGLVPTMGALHEAHLSLVRRARRENDRVVVSIFVNPLQFGPEEDLARYPRPFGRDAELCRGAGTDALYHPSPAAMYGTGFATSVSVAGLSELHCGASRPGHFEGVATVVLKLLNQVRPDRLYLGEKDFQQLSVVRRMAADLDLGVEVVGCRLLRAPDGLALSSRNMYLSPERRAAAPALYAALKAAAAAARLRGAGPASVLRAGRAALSRAKAFRLDYLALVDEETLRPAERLGGRQRLLAAAWLGNTRLIDNLALRV
ncbi:MAG: pantoate--beta-alanine ligase [Elusimicrobia bacterium]|nr:pantoate--beta-alanine ligase [Elusimicrobiota bacterium]